jgi:hypothetical protein
MSQREWRTTGHVVEVPGQVDRIPDFDPRSGDHLWTVLQMHRVNPELLTDPTHTPFLDAESLLTIQGPGCYYCEEPYTRQRATRRCPGHPRH